MFLHSPLCVHCASTVCFIQSNVRPLRKPRVFGECASTERARRMHVPEMRSRSKNDGILRHRWPSQRLPRSPRRLNLFAKNPILRRKRFLCLAFDTPDQRSPRDRPKVWCFHSGRTLDCIKHTVDAQWTHSGLCKNIGIHDFAFRIN